MRTEALIKGRTVGAAEALTHQTFRTQRLLDLAATWEDVPEPAPSRASRAYRTMRQLRSDEVDELVDAYKAGATTRDLAAQFGIHRMTVSKHLRSRGIDTTPPGLTPDQLTKAIQLYESGEPLSQIAVILSAPQSTIRDHLHAAGVTMREAVKPRKVRPDQAAASESKHVKDDQ